ncbi:hypothetical protein J7W19_03120 [Streptomyces mobaraensis NBRC 13819 = DSM 40847]|nr:hypothetical protein [Streptomyces mobaraensis]QTT78255.1 hypothetical protein J7W19_03120 [Streptomyces mobaraensis NBRC 13819 = DSM 40847]
MTSSAAGAWRTRNTASRRRTPDPPGPGTDGRAGQSPASATRDSRATKPNAQRQDEKSPIALPSGTPRAIAVVMPA